MLRPSKDNFILLETNRFDKDNRRSFLFTDPITIISCKRWEDIRASFKKLEDYISRGYYAAGFVSYEAGFSFEDNLKGDIKENRFPLMWFGIYKKPTILMHREGIDILPRSTSSYTIANLHPNISREKYTANIKKIKDFIRRGDTYQVNYTFKYKFDFRGCLFSLYKDLKKKQSVSYSAFIKTPEFSILSLSPELFFRKDSKRLEVRPMKGTIDRGRNLPEDIKKSNLLRDSIKDRSENLMIVDLLRNDLGKISEPGSVKTMKLFEVERYETLLQMVSIVKSILKDRIALYDLFRAIFPSGSVTGAPKISTMKIIRSLEKETRNIYTGGIGFFAPGGKAVFNVAIRTISIDNRINRGEMGVGSGIVYDSDPYREFDECKLKARFITDKEKMEFKLIETILYQPGNGYFLLSLHLNRLSSSAEYFNFRFDRKRIIRELNNLKSYFKNAYDYKVRLFLDKDGRVRLRFERISGDTKIKKVRFSRKKTDSGNIFLHHKTTNRRLYDEEYSRWSKLGYFDVIFTNEKNQVTEGAISNIIIKKKGIYYTPGLESGALDGVFRRHLLKSKKIPLKEKILYRKDIELADEIYMVNSVRGMKRVML